MSHFQVTVFGITLALLIILAAFFSAAETALMAINRYRLRHKARLKLKYAILILKLLKRPDRLLGMILIGSNCANIIASALATLLAVSLFGEKSVIISTILLTVVVLIIAEIAPKTLAAIYPDPVSKIVAWPVYALLTVFYPIVWFMNALSNGLLRMLGFNLKGQVIEQLTRDELRNVVFETTGRSSSQYQQMLLGILDLNKVTVNDVMIPSHEIVGINLESDWKQILNEIASSEYDWLPIYRDNINHVAGILHLRDFLHQSIAGTIINKERLLSILHEPYFIPEGTPLNIQLVNFQSHRKRQALIVDEYGEILGLITLEDILEEIVGEFTTTVVSSTKTIKAQPDGSFLVDGGITLRELNRATQWKLPTNGPRTLNGLIVEQLEAIPRPGVCVLIASHPIEIVNVKENRVKMARIFPRIVK